MIPYQDTQEANKIVKKRIPYFGGEGKEDLEALLSLHFASQKFWQVSIHLWSPRQVESGGALI